MTTTQLARAFGVLLTALATCGGASAQAGPPGAGSAEPRHWFQLHGTAGEWQMKSRYDEFFVGSTPGVPVDMESDLGLSRRGTVAGLSFGRRLGERWRIEVDQSTSRRRGSRLLPADLAVDGVVYAGGTVLRSDIGVSTLRINGGWSFIKDERAELGVLFGGQWIKTSRKLEGFGPGFAGGAPVPQSRDDDDLAPVPLVGAYGSAALGGNWRLQGRAEFGVDDNRFTQLQVSAQWWATPHLALGLGYRHTRAKLDILFGFFGCCSSLQVDYQVRGPVLTVDLAF